MAINVDAFQRGRRFVRDINTHASSATAIDRLPVQDGTTTFFPVKGGIMYNRAVEVAGEDGIIYYGDGTKWIPLSGTVTLTNVGTIPTGSLVPGSPQSGPALTLRGLIGGTGITISNNATDVTITNNSPATSVTLADAGVVDPHQSLVVDGVGPDLTVKGISAGLFTEVITTINNNVQVGSLPNVQFAAVQDSVGAVVHSFAVHGIMAPSADGLVATVYSRDTSVASNIAANATITIAGVIPVAFRPLANQSFFVGVTYDTGTSAAAVTITTAGDIVYSFPTWANGITLGLFSTWGTNAVPWQGLANSFTFYIPLT